ncbi:MAG: hypothetical protein RL757_294 [Bacteroidota bacterium]|jgi:hypothetical protein
MKKTNLILSAAALLLGGLAYWVFANNNNKTNMKGGDWEFAIADTAAVYKIFIADHDRRTVLLERKGKNEWTLNGKGNARIDAVKNLLETVHHLEVNYRLPRDQVKTVVEELSTGGIKCELYGKDGKMIKCFYVGGVDQSEKGTFFIQCDANEPYALRKNTGFVGSLRPYFFTDTLAWRDRTVFNESVEEIESVTVDYPSQKDKSFKIFRKGGDYSVEPVYPMQMRPPTNINKGICERFLMGFAGQVAEGFENDALERDSVSATVPFAIINMKKTNGTTKIVKLHSILGRNKKGEIIATENIEQGVAVDRYFADCSWGDFMIVQNVMFERILFPYQSFFHSRSE